MVQPQNKRILIVEDEKDLREILLSRFEMFGFQTLEADGGELALEIFKTRGPIDIIVTDIRMPKGSGLDLLRNIKKINPSAPKVFLMSAAEGLLRRELYDLGAEGFLEKPYDTRVLIEMVRKSLLSNKERWQIAPSLNSNYNLKVRFDSHEEASKHKHFLLGRGGFCTETDQALPPLEQPINIEIDVSPFKAVGMARIKWVERLGGRKQLAGFEFLHLRGEGVENIYRWIDENSPAAYVPGAFKAQ